MVAPTFRARGTDPKEDKTMYEKNPLKVTERPLDPQELVALKKQSKESLIPFTHDLAESVDEVNISVKVGETVLVITIDYGAGIALASTDSTTGTLLRDEGSWIFIVDGLFKH